MLPVCSPCVTPWDGAEVRVTLGPGLVSGRAVRVRALGLKLGSGLGLACSVDRARVALTSCSAQATARVRVRVMARVLACSVDSG